MFDTPEYLHETIPVRAAHTGTRRDVARVDVRWNGSRLWVLRLWSSNSGREWVYEECSTLRLRRQRDKNPLGTET